MRRRAIGVLIAAVTIAACAGSGDDVATDATTSSTAPTTTTTTEPTSSSVTDTSSTTSTEAMTTTGPTTTGPTTTVPTTATTASPTTTGAPTTGAPTTTAAPSTTAPPTTAPPTTAGGPRPLGEASIAVVPIGRADVPTALRTHPTNGSAWVAEKAGVVRSFPDGGAALDIRSLVRNRGEQGLLGIAFSAAGDRLYVSYSDAASGGDSIVAEYAFAGGIADPASRRELLRVAQPYSNHNGGDIHLGPDGMLWIALGDGGSSGDPGENGQDPTTLLGSILRIDPTRPTGDRPYAIPADNPFAAGGGAPEVWLFGVRNPWRIAFDRATGDLFVADVGQDRWEEVTVLPAAQGRGRAANLGWDQVEGTHPYEGAAPAGSTGPAFEYSHAEGCSITGGFVYRGAAIPDLTGAYLFADLCRSNLRAIRTAGNSATEAAAFGVDVGTPIAFGQEASGEIVVLSQQGTIYRIVPA